MKSAILLLIKAYQYFISPLIGNCCRFYPSCSSYTTSAIKKFGLSKGSFLGIKRISKCHPWNKGGFDPIPEKKYDK